MFVNRSAPHRALLYQLSGPPATNGTKVLDYFTGQQLATVSANGQFVLPVTRSGDGSGTRVVVFTNSNVTPTPPHHPHHRHHRLLHPRHRHHHLHRPLHLHRHTLVSGQYHRLTHRTFVFNPVKNVSGQEARSWVKYGPNLALAAGDHQLGNHTTKLSGATATISYTGVVSSCLALKADRTGR